MRDAIDTTDRPLVLVWEVTQACALACQHCRADAQPNRHPDELTTEEGKRLLREAAAFGDGQLVVLSGGDPLARGDLLELVRYGATQGNRMTITPSGTHRLTTERIRALSEAGIKRVALSLDGATAASHDAFRGEESYDDTIAAARGAEDVGVPLQINTTVCADTVADLPAIRDRVRELGAVLWSVFFLVPVGRGRVLDPLTPDRAESVMEWLRAVEADAPFRVKTTEAPFYRRVSMQAGGEPPRLGGITAGNGFMFVSHTGEVYPSGFLPASSGNVRDATVVEHYRNDDRFETLRDTDALTGKCGACSYRGVCGGSRSRAYAYTGDPTASDPLCPYIPDGYDGPLPSSWEETQAASTTE